MSDSLWMTQTTGATATLAHNSRYLSTRATTTLTINLPTNGKALTGTYPITVTATPQAGEAQSATFTVNVGLDEGASKSWSVSVERTVLYVVGTGTKTCADGIVHYYYGEKSSGVVKVTINDWDVSKANWAKLEIWVESPNPTISAHISGDPNIDKYYTTPFYNHEPNEVRLQWETPKSGLSCLSGFTNASGRVIFGDVDENPVTFHVQVTVCSSPWPYYDEAVSDGIWLKLEAP